MNKLAMHAARAYARILTPIMREAEEAESYDRHFDGGEWSSGFHSRYQQEVCDLVAQRVAQRFGIPVSDLEDADSYRQNEGWHRWMESQMKRDMR